MTKSRLLGLVLSCTINICISIPANAVVHSIIDLGTLGGSSSEGHDINYVGQISGYSTTTGNASGRAFLYDENGMQNIGTLGNSSYGWSVNDIGYVAGTYYSGTIDRAFLYNGSALQDIGTLGGISADAYDINNSGQIVGSSNISGDTATHAFLYENGDMQDLGTLGGNDSQAYGINNNGQVTGYSRITGSSTSVFIYRQLKERPRRAVYEIIE